MWKNKYICCSMIAQSADGTSPTMVDVATSYPTTWRSREARWWLHSLSCSIFYELIQLHRAYSTTLTPIHCFDFPQIIISSSRSRDPTQQNHIQNHEVHHTDICTRHRLRRGWQKHHIVTHRGRASCNLCTDCSSSNSFSHRGYDCDASTGGLDAASCVDFTPCIRAGE